MTRRGDAGTLSRLAGARYWTASILPALVGTTLPFWLRPRGFSFRWTSALEFLAAVVLVHSGFAFLHARFEHRGAGDRGGTRLLGATGVCAVAAGAVWLHLAQSTPRLLFTAYGLAVVIAGLLFVAPPARLSRHPGGEIAVAMSLGMLPLLGAYLVQTGDLTRKVYLASLPIYAATLIWVWTEEMAPGRGRESEERESLVTLFGRRVSGRVIVPALTILLCLTVVAAVLSSSVTPLALAALPVLAVPMWWVVSASWSAHDDAAEMAKARRGAIAVHSALCIVLAASSLLAADS